MKHGQAACFEIPVTKKERAIKFYNDVLKINLENINSLESIIQNS